MPATSSIFPRNIRVNAENSVPSSAERFNMGKQWDNLKNYLHNFAINLIKINSTCLITARKMCLQMPPKYTKHIFLKAT